MQTLYSRLVVLLRAGDTPDFFFVYCSSSTVF